jgi:hypothetical protein
VAGPLLSRKLGAKPGAEVTVFFTTSRAELEARFGALKETLAPADGGEGPKAPGGSYS